MVTGMITTVESRIGNQPARVPRRTARAFFVMDDLEQRLLRIEERLKVELGLDGFDGQLWKTLDAHSQRLTSIDNTIYRGNGKDSLVTQITKLRTEMRTLAGILGVLIPVGFKVVDLWLSS